MSFTGITGLEKEPGLDCDEEYFIEWDIPVEQILFPGSMDLFRNPGNKTIYADVVYLQEGQHLELYCMNENSNLSEAFHVGSCSGTQQQFCIDEFVRTCDERDHIFLVIFNRGTEIPQFSIEPDWYSFPSFHDSRDGFLNVVEETEIPPGLCAIVDLGPLSDLDGMASLSFADGGSVELTWEENPGGGGAPLSGGPVSSGGCALSIMSKESLIIFLALFLVFIWKP